MSLDTLHGGRDPVQGMIQKRPNHSKAEQRKVRYALEAGQTTYNSGTKKLIWVNSINVLLNVFLAEICKQIRLRVER